MYPTYTYPTYHKINYKKKYEKKNKKKNRYGVVEVM